MSAPECNEAYEQFYKARIVIGDHGYLWSNATIKSSFNAGWEAANNRADIPAARIAELEAEVARLLEAIADTPERSRIEELKHQAERDTGRIHDLSDEVERLRGVNAALRSGNDVLLRAALDKDATP